MIKITHATYSTAKVLVFFLSLLSCEKKNTSSETLGFVSPNEDTWRESEVPVCWEVPQSTKVPEESKQIVRETIEREFNSEIGIQFIGWQDCAQLPPLKGFSVTFTDLNYSSVDGFGRANRRLKLGTMHSCSKGSTNYLTSNCLRNVALHEFGHAAGLHHEMNRMDVSFDECRVKQSIWKYEDALHIGPKDLESVMNYCAVIRAAETDTFIGLSAGDKATIRELYKGQIAYLKAHTSSGQTYSTYGGYEGWAGRPNLPINFEIAVENPRNPIKAYRFKKIPPGEGCESEGYPWSPLQNASTKLDSQLVFGDNLPVRDEEGSICVLASEALDATRYTKLIFIIGNLEKRAITNKMSLERYEILRPDSYLTSGNTFAIMQSDSNFAIYRGSHPGDNRGLIWQTGKLRSSPLDSSSGAIIDSDCRLKLYIEDVASASAISNNEPLNSHCRAVMQVDGNLCIYDVKTPNSPRWCSGTNRPEAITNIWRLEQHQALFANHFLTSGNTFAILQSDSNFVIYRGSNPGNNQGFVWQAGRSGDGVAEVSARLTSDCRLGAFQNETLVRYLSSNAPKNADCSLRMQSDGNLCIYDDRTGGGLWCTYTHFR